MRNTAIILVLALLAAVATGQEGAGNSTGTVWENSSYRVKATVPTGWSQIGKEPKSRGSWVELAAFAEVRSGAKLTVSVQASSFPNADAMIKWQRAQFEKDSGLAVLRDEVRPASKRRPKGVLFEYTYQSKRKPQHAVAVYWVHRERRYRAYATVREVGWKTVASDIRSFVKSVEFTSRAFTKEIHNYTDEKGNFRFYFPEGWTIKLPARRPRVIFTSAKRGISVWVYTDPSTGKLDGDWTRHLRTLGETGAKIGKKTAPKRHSDLGVEVGVVEYTKTTGGKLYRYRESVLTHRRVFYRIVLAAADTAFAGGVSDYEQMVKSIAFMK